MTPVRSVIEGKNGRLIAEAARLWINPDDEVLDLTYGRGMFWTEYRPANLVTNDRHVPGCDLAIDYRRGPAGMVNWCDVVIFDPPYITTGNRATSKLGGRNGDGDFFDRYGLNHTPRGWHNLFADNAAGVHTCAQIVRPGGIVMVKCMDYVESGAIRWGRRAIVEAAYTAGLVQVDEFVHHSGTGPQPSTNRDGTPRRQQHSRRAHSFLCVFRKPLVRVRPWREIRRKAA